MLIIKMLVIFICLFKVMFGGVLVVSNEWGLIVFVKLVEFNIKNLNWNFLWK